MTACDGLSHPSLHISPACENTPTTACKSSPVVMVVDDTSFGGPLSLIHLGWSVVGGQWPVVRRSSFVVGRWS
jgi:hypothetical protein